MLFTYYEILKKKKVEKFVDHKGHCRPRCRRTTVILSIFDDAHKFELFSVHDDKHTERVLYYYIFNTGRQGICMCLFLYVVHLLYHEIGLK